MPRSQWNPPVRFRAHQIEWEGEPPPADLEVVEEHAREILAHNDSPDIGFDWSLNPYRGCFHACAYCYARPSHAFWGWGAGTDFERRLTVKVNAPERLREAFDRRSWRGETVAFSGNTDCYQPLEARYGLTRRCLEVCLEYRNPVTVITKGLTVRRDAELLATLAAEARATVTISIPFADEAMARALEPNASGVAARFETLRLLTDAGVPTRVAVAPVIPGLGDSQIPEILERARAAGATGAFMVLLRLPREVHPVFEARLTEAFPLRARRVMEAVRELRSGAANDPRFGHRMRGAGPRWAATEAIFDLHARRLGLRVGGDGDATAEPSPFRRPTRQLPLL